MPTIQYSAGSAPLYLIGGSLGPPDSLTQTASRSLQPFLPGSLGDRPTDHATRSLTIGGIYVRSTVMWSNNNCSISRLLGLKLKDLRIFEKFLRFLEKGPLMVKFQNSVPDVFIATPINVLSKFREIWPTGNR